MHYLASVHGPRVSRRHAHKVGDPPYRHRCARVRPPADTGLIGDPGYTRLPAGSSPIVGAATPHHHMDLLAYFRVLRRHWRLIVAVTVAGAALGAASTLLDDSSPTKQAYFRATHTLVFDASTNSDRGASPRHYGNPSQVAILTTTGDVPDAVAEKLGDRGSGRRRSRRGISTLVNQDSATLDITAIDADPQRATLLADTFADELIASLTAKEQDAFTKDSTH